MNRRISKQAYGNLCWVFLSHWYNLFNNLQYSRVFFLLYFFSSIQYGENEIHIVIVIASHCLIDVRLWNKQRDLRA